MISSQAQKAFGNLARLLASSALTDTALKLMPGGSIRPFCEPLMLTSTPHSSCLYSAEARPEMVSTSSSAGCFAASMALRTAAMLLVTPVEVSLCTTQTALMLCCVSALSRSSIRSARTPWRQTSAPGSVITSVLRPMRVASFCQRAAKWPVSYISTWSPALSVLTSAASQAPVPEAG